MEKNVRRGEHYAPLLPTAVPSLHSHMAISDSVRSLNGLWQDAGQMAGYKRVWWWFRGGLTSIVDVKGDTVVCKPHNLTKYTYY